MSIRIDNSDVRSYSGQGADKSSARETEASAAAAITPAAMAWSGLNSFEGSRSPTEPRIELSDARGGRYAQIDGSRCMATDATNATTGQELRAEGASIEGSNPYGRDFLLKDPSANGGMVIQRVTWSELKDAKGNYLNPDHSWKPTQTYYEAFPVNANEKQTRPSDQFGVKKGDDARVEAEATFYEGMTEAYLKSQGFQPFGARKAGPLWSKQMDDVDGRMTFDNYKGSNTCKDVWECVTDRKSGLCKDSGSHAASPNDK